MEYLAKKTTSWLGIHGGAIGISEGATGIPGEESYFLAGSPWGSLYTPVYSPVAPYNRLRVMLTYHRQQHHRFHSDQRRLHRNCQCPLHQPHHQLGRRGGRALEPPQTATTTTSTHTNSTSTATQPTRHRPSFDEKCAAPTPPPASAAPPSRPTQFCSYTATRG